LVSSKALLLAGKGLRDGRDPALTSDRNHKLRNVRFALVIAGAWIIVVGTALVDLLFGLSGGTNLWLVVFQTALGALLIALGAIPGALRSSSRKQGPREVA
jgi:hypothetical protein